MPRRKGTRPYALPCTRAGHAVCQDTDEQGLQAAKHLFPLWTRAHLEAEERENSSCQCLFLPFTCGQHERPPSDTGPRDLPHAPVRQPCHPQPVPRPFLRHFSSESVSVRRRSSRNSERVLEEKARRRLCSAACRVLALRETAGGHRVGWPGTRHGPGCGRQRRRDEQRARRARGGREPPLTSCPAGCPCAPSACPLPPPPGPAHTLPRSLPGWHPRHGGARARRRRDNGWGTQQRHRHPQGDTAGDGGAGQPPGLTCALFGGAGPLAGAAAVAQHLAAGFLLAGGRARSGAAGTTCAGSRGQVAVSAAPAARGPPRPLPPPASR